MTNAFGKIVCPPPGGKCLIALNGDIACSPPYSGIVKTYDGKILCGPGKCVITAFGKAFSSAEMQGSATEDACSLP